MDGKAARGSRDDTSPAAHLLAAINARRAAGHRNIAAGLRHASCAPFTRPLDLHSTRRNCL